MTGEERERTGWGRRAKTLLAPHPGLRSRWARMEAGSPGLGHAQSVFPLWLSSPSLSRWPLIWLPSQAPWGV